MSSDKIVTVKAARTGEFPGPLIYKHMPLVIVGPERNVLWAGSQDEFLKDQFIASGYYDNCELCVREHDLYLNDNTRIESAQQEQQMETKHTQHTPGPWKVEKIKVSEKSEVLGVCGEGKFGGKIFIAQVSGHAGYETSEADARLIAAAPALLAALQVCLKVLKTPHGKRNRPDGTSEGTAIRAIEATIAQALGQ